MNRRFHEQVRNGNNVNIDRQFFMNNTRQDKNWIQQSQKPQQQLSKNDINADRVFFNIATNQISQNTNSQIADRNFSQYAFTNSIRNKEIYNDTGKRIYSSNTRNDKILLDTEKNNFINRSVNSNPFARDVNIGVTRIESIDTKNAQSNQLKIQPSKKNKFNPFAIY
jgi:hypothetical protein